MTLLDVQAPKSETPLLVSAAAAAKILDCSTNFVRRLGDQGRLKRIKLGHLVKFRLRDIEAVVENGLGGVR